MRVAVLAWVVVDDLRRARAGDWPSCEGVLVERGTTPLRRGEEVRTDLKLRYTYKVGGVEYAGDRIAIGDMSYSLAADAKRELDELYPAGRPVKVYYNPANPAEAVLQPAPMSWIRTIGAGVFCTVMAVAGVGSRVHRARKLLGAGPVRHAGGWFPRNDRFHLAGRAVPSVDLDGRPVVVLSRGRTASATASHRSVAPRSSRAAARALAARTHSAHRAGRR